MSEHIMKRQKKVLKKSVVFLLNFFLNFVLFGNSRAGDVKHRINFVWPNGTKRLA